MLICFGHNPQTGEVFTRVETGDPDFPEERRVTFYDVSTRDDGSVRFFKLFVPPSGRTVWGEPQEIEPQTLTPVLA